MNRPNAASSIDTDNLLIRSRPGNSKFKDRRLPWLLLAPTIITLMLLTVYPLIYSLNASFYSFRFGEIANFVGLDNFRRLLSDGLFWDSLGITAVYTVLAVLIELVLGFSMALLLYKEKRFQGVMRTVLIIPMMLSPVVVGVIWRLMYNTDTGIINYLLTSLGLPAQDWLGDPALALFSVILVDVWQWTPFMFLLILAGLQALPEEPFEAARIDGANRWQEFREITLPLLKPVLLVAILIRSMDAFRIFDQIFILTKGGPGTSTETVSLYLYKAAFKFWDVGYAAAALLIVMVLITAVSQFLIQKLSDEMA